MEVSAKMLNYSVLKDSISVQLVCGDAGDPSLPVKLTALQGQSRHLLIGDLDTKGFVKSVGIRKGIHILLHLPCTQYVAKRLFYLMTAGENIRIKLAGENESKLRYLLERAAKKTGQSHGDLLRELTTFKNKHDKIVEGRESIEELSPRFQEVVICKLSRILKEVGADVQCN